jgi:hypothetical protein
MSNQSEIPSNGEARPSGLSWGAMLALLAGAILIAIGVAYLLVYPFFHQNAPLK